MSNYAQIINGVVINVIVADADFIATQTNKTYVLCSRGGIGWTFDGANFIAPKPFASWTLDSNYDWQAPIPQPPPPPKTMWDEESQEWIPDELN